MKVFNNTTDRDQPFSTRHLWIIIIWHKCVTAAFNIHVVFAHAWEVIRIISTLNELIFTTTGGGPGAPPAFRLDIVIRESVTGVLVKQTGDVTSQVYQIEADFKLYRIGEKDMVFGGTTRSKASFDKFDPIFSNVRAKLESMHVLGFGEAIDIAQMAVYLASNESRLVTGQVFPVDSGLTVK